MFYGNCQPPFLPTEPLFRGRAGTSIAGLNNNLYTASSTVMLINVTNSYILQKQKLRLCILSITDYPLFFCLC